MFFQATSTESQHAFIECVANKRLLTLLSYYNRLNVLSVNDQTVFCNFMDEIYAGQIFDNHHHLTKYHQHQLQQILDFGKETGALSN